MGTAIMCIKTTSDATPPGNSFASWKDGDFLFHLLPRHNYAVERADQSLRPEQSLPKNMQEPQHHLIYEAGSRSAIWFLGNEAVCKVHAWKEGLQLESETIAFVSEHFPTIPVPEVLYAWVDESINRSFLIMKRIHARTLDVAWTQLTHHQRINIAKEVAEHTATLASKTCCYLQTISGCGIGIPSLMQGYEHESPIHNWFPRTIGPLSSTNLRDYMSAISSTSPPSFDDTFLLFHDDQGPTNILVSAAGDKVEAIIDWTSAAYLPRFWIATVALAHAGFTLDDDNSDAWARMLVKALETHGSHERLSEFQQWRSRISKHDTDKDKLEWRKVHMNGRDDQTES
jgi:hypothetical protein